LTKYRKISNVLWIILLANVLVASVKMILGTVLNINSLTADGFHAVTDSSSNIIGLIGIKLASKPADKDHPYGHRKFETISGLFIGVMLTFITLQIIYSAITWFIDPKDPRITIPSLIALVITLFINIFVARYEYKKGIELESDVLISDSIHTKSDILISSGVLITLILIRLGLPTWIDPVVSLIIAAFVFHSCYEIFKSTIGVLVDKKILDEDTIKKLILEMDEEIKDVHRIRSRGRNDHIFIDLHIHIDAEKTVEEAHVLSHKIEAVLREKLDRNIELIAHIEPHHS
jgi:cation diffusion facilitator family transporter